MDNKNNMNAGAKGKPNPMQITLFQLDNYGPWTVTPEPRPEPELQALQARLYADLAEMVGEAGGYVFFGRFDNMVAITNQLSRDDHAAILEALDDTYPVSVSAGIGSGKTPSGALAKATEALQNAGSAQSDGRTGVLTGEGATTPGTLSIAHFDVVDVTDRLTDRVDAYESQLRVKAGVQDLSERIYEAWDGLAFFVGGDNVIAVVPDKPTEAYNSILDEVATATGLRFQVGVGTGDTAREAGMKAKHALECCREENRRIVGLDPAHACD